MGKLKNLKLNAASLSHAEMKQIRGGNDGDDLLGCVVNCYGENRMFFCTGEGAIIDCRDGGGAACVYPNGQASGWTCEGKPYVMGLW